MAQKLFLTGLTLSSLFLGGCAIGFGHNAAVTLPPYIHKLAVRPFSNHTQQYGLEDKLTLAVQAELNRDGRYQVTTENQADGVIIGDITKYILEPLSYDANHVPTEYKLWIDTTISFLDKSTGQISWQEPEMYGELRYFVASSGFAGAMTEDDARTTIFDELSRDIVTRTIEGPSTKREPNSGIGPEKSTDTVHTDNSPPAMPDTNPPGPPPRLPY